MKSSNHIKSAEFKISSPKFDACPKTNESEFAFIGRSNVGKSSLINTLTSKKNLAKASSTPGKTQLINFFLINKEWYLVDLPGYGYARVGKEKKNVWNQMIQEYLLQRKQLKNVFLLVDCRHKPLENDLEFIEWLGLNGIPFSIVFTKSDKVSKNELQKNIALYKRILKKTWEELPPVFSTSSLKKEGYEEILDYIHLVLNINE